MVWRLPCTISAVWATAIVSQPTVVSTCRATISCRGTFDLIGASLGATSGSRGRSSRSK
jgi:hypothetical protein